MRFRRLYALSTLGGRMFNFKTKTMLTNLDTHTVENGCFLVWWNTRN